MNRHINIISRFKTEGDIISVKPFGSGHINDSYLVTTSPEPATNYLLQRINHKIFTNVGELTNNIRRITKHLQQKLISDQARYGHFQTIHLTQTRSGGYYTQDEEGNYWRLYNHVRQSRSYDMLENPELAYEGGKAFATFQYLTSDFKADTLFEILPNFHNIAFRLSNFREVVRCNPAHRVRDAKEEIDFVESRVEEMHTILRLGELGKIPLRVTHNDTKCNNVLFNPENKAIAVVDLDTVMPGYVLYDFGDAIRTGASTGAEDEADLLRVNIDLDLFTAYAKGYLGIARNFLNTIEINHLAFSAKFMTYLIGLRFLTDHIDGDHYFKIGFPGHNLQRARAQFKLVQSMEEHFTAMRDIINKALDG